MEFECFRTGVHTDSRGISREFTQEDLDFMVSSYNPKHHEAPIVIGHPESNAPAYGWIESVRRSGQTLIARAVKLVPEFIDALKQGLFKKRSISLNSDGTLRHIGFLGAVPPAVKGLKDLEFSAAAEISSYEFDSPAEEEITLPEETPVIETLPLPEHTAAPVEKEGEISGLETNSLTQPSPVDEGSGSLQEHPIPDEPVNANPDTIPPQPASAPAQAAAFSDYAALEEEVRKNVLKSIEDLFLKKRRAEFDIWLDEKISFGSVTPAMRPVLVKLMEFISSGTFDHESRSYVYDFSGEKSDPLDLLRCFVDALPRLPLLQEIPPPAPAPPPVADSFGSFSVDTVSLDLHERVLALASQEKIPYIQALHRINAQ